MKKIWKTIDKFNFSNIEECLAELSSKNYVLSEWIKDIFKNYKFILKKNDFPIHLYRVSVKELGLTGPSKLMDIYDKFKKEGFDLVPPEIALVARMQYDEQKTGEWLRFATPRDSMIDSDGVPHLPKLGRALNKYFIETYWSYPEAIFHPHNEFVVKK